ncbi:uncharacterized protein N7477_008537 [Penicillium maclennaniae]|uniref:uncharacterized protein n=1 Tax=Penicillium maclennaniae TaxID=1343394 RepID=UPI0025425DBB|nr:uncharacterized protein N7477_008537 [Penicillium maclennaniae]KAJ5666089.1 hypothetical protein N7477_008537 [Penicillium maclennaniae]
MGNVEGLSSEESAEKNRVPSDTLRRAPHIVILALLYAVVAIFAWAALCILNHRPIGARSYQPNLGSKTELEDYLGGAKRQFRYNRASSSGFSNMPIPGFGSDHPVDFHGLLSMALADKGWNDPVLITKLIAGGWKRYGSVFLVFALVLNLIGASIAPFQGLFVSYKSIKVPTKMSSMDLIDLEKWITWAADPIHDNDVAEPATKLRSRLISTSNSDPQFRLWSSGEGCTNSTDGSNQACNKSGQSTFGIMPNISDPFWAQPPVGFRTGLWQQFAPRVNFTTKYDKILADDFPKDCRDEPGALFIHYENMTDIGGYIVDICMPGDQKQSPWKATRKRQDFSEEFIRQNDSGLEGGI